MTTTTVHPLHRLRQTRRLSQAGLAIQAGCSPTTVLLIEKWGHIPPELVRQRLAQALGVPETDIWPEQPPETAV